MALSAVLAESRNAFEQVSQRAQDVLKRAKPRRASSTPMAASCGQRPINLKVLRSVSLCRRVRRLHSFLQRGSPAAKAKRKEALSLSRGQSSGGQARAHPGAPAAPVTTVHGRRAARFLPLPERSCRTCLLLADERCCEDVETLRSDHV